MTQEITTITPLFSTPYLTNEEYKQAPTAVDVDDLVGGGTEAVNSQELANVIARASSMIDAHCGQVLAATTDTDSFRARISRDGFLRVHPRYWPIVSVQSGSYGSFPNQMVALDPTTAWIEQMSIVFPLQGFGTSFLGPIQFGGIYQPNMEQFVTLTYTNGYANTVLSSDVTPTDPPIASIDVDDLTGFLPNQQFMIYDGSSTEILRVSSAWVPTSGPGTLSLVSQCRYSHLAGISVSALPPAVKQAAIFVTNSLLKSRGNSAIVMSSLTPSSIQQGSASGDSDLRDAYEILKPYRRIT